MNKQDGERCCGNCGAWLSHWRMIAKPGENSDNKHHTNVTVGECHMIPPVLERWPQIMSHQFCFSWIPHE